MPLLMLSIDFLFFKQIERGGFFFFLVSAVYSLYFSIADNSFVHYGEFAVLFSLHCIL